LVVWIGPRRRFTAETAKTAEIEEIEFTAGGSQDVLRDLCVLSYEKASLL
jgi:hypothetical protein